jgi:hypothetical protein
MPTKPKATVKQNPENEVPLEIMAESIVALSQFGKKMSASRLRQRAVLLLLKDMTGISPEKIKKILDALPDLEQQYLK